jgi:hypothetical protein
MTESTSIFEEIQRVVHNSKKINSQKPIARSQTPILGLNYTGSQTSSLDVEPLNPGQNKIFSYGLRITHKAPRITSPRLHPPEKRRTYRFMKFPALLVYFLHF